jgi:hypothetical protein
MNYRIAAALTFAVTLVAPSAALADKPLREVQPLQPDIVTQRCGFPVLVHSEGEIFRNTWFDDAGNPVRAIETYPGLKYVLTNLVTQTQIAVSIVGPSFWEFAPDGSATVSSAGPTGWFPHPVTREPGIFLIRGRYTFELDASGRVTSFRLLSGQIDNLCPRLA